ncbi:NAD(P)/FAD-dependent oxidoreductase [Neopusillimonas maritima]|uniref:Pyridine nucleotide-disulfide oxidoreductase n=1 Tax=Neopusillimonas maritima TaxID=2026239 RepID=A0A3A1YUV4_9BURK|nr:FAD/NAD(P)-binding oxidoreductase [Neopusillimonas maritima]RIY41301.1 pyridine nucleotide-disulfide oxidoreductase [Neopusillimonas maritima]
MKRRDFLTAAGLSALGISGAGRSAFARDGKGARLVIAGAGAAGLSLASRLSSALENAKIIIIDERKEHIFQPGLTLVGAGLWPAQKVIDQNAQYIPEGVEWVQEAIAEFDPEANQVVTARGRTFAYDFLFVATGLALDYTAIDGMDAALIGRKGIASVYAGPQAAAASAQVIDTYIEQGGVGLFGRPATEMKCAGAPLKMTFITDDKARTNGRRDGLELTYNAHNNGVFGVPPVNEKVTSLFEERDIKVNYSHVLQAIDSDRKVARFTTPNGDVALDYDFIHVVPPMRAPQAVRQSLLPWQSGLLANDGWVEANKDNLRHPRYANVFSVGDVAGVPRGKTAASVKWQVPVVVDHVLADIANKESKAVYNGYTSCPLITRYGKAMLIEFDYDGKLVPSFPFIEPLEELWVSWLIDEKVLHGTYRAMLRGHA